MSRKSLRWQERALKKLEDTRLLLSLRFLNFKISTRVPETCQNDGTGIFFPKEKYDCKYSHPDCVTASFVATAVTPLT